MSMASPSTLQDADERMDMDETPPASPAPSPSTILLQTPARNSHRRPTAFAARGSSRTSPLPPTTPMTPNRVRACDERLLRRGQVIAGEVSRRRKKYEFQMLPESGHGTGSNSPSREASPARYSPEEVTNAVMSFADFLYFLEEKQQEHPLMPTIIARFSELGAVIESQKRHIDLWKRKELDLALSEAEQSYEVIRDMGLQLEKSVVKLSDEQVQKQMWEEKYNKAVQEAKSAAHRAHDEITHLNAKIHELQFQKQDLENAVKTGNDQIANMQRDFDELRKTAQQMDTLGSTVSYEKRSLAERCERQEQAFQTLQSQMQQLQQQCEAERARADELNNAAHGWEIKYQEERRLREHLEGDLAEARRERDEHGASIKRLLSESGKYRAELEASSIRLEHQMQIMGEKLQSKDAEIADLLQKLKVESERVQKQTQDMKSLRKQAEDGIVAMKSDLEQNFVTQVARLREELGGETTRVRAENEELQQRCQHLQQLTQKKSNQITELMNAQQNWVGEGNETLTKLTSAVGEWQAKCDQLQQEIRDREKANADALRQQGADIQEQFNSHVQEMEAYVDRKNAEIEQLRGAVKARDDDLIKLREEAHNEISKWRGECQELSNKNSTLEFECGALHREIEHRNKALELREKELEALKHQVAAYLAPDNDRTKQTELLHRERLRLEEQNHHLKRQIEEMKRDFDKKFDELNSTNHRATEQESAQRATIVSLHHEKDDMQRALSDVSGEKVALEGHLQGMLEEKEILEESLSQYEKQNGDLEEKVTELLQALGEFEEEKAHLLQALESARAEKTEVEGKLSQLTEDLRQQQHLHLRSIEQHDVRAQVEALTAKLQRRDAEVADLQQQMKSLYQSSRAAEESRVRVENVLREREEELKNAKRNAESADEKHRSSDMKQAQLRKEVAQLRDWNERYKNEITSLNSQAGERSLLEIRCQQLTSEAAQLRGSNERYKKEIESLKSQAEDRERRRRSEAEARESELMRQGRGLEAQYEKVKGDLASLQISAEQEVRRLRIALDNQKAEFQLEHQRLVATNERLERQARSPAEEYASLKSELSRVRDELTQVNGDLEFHRTALQQREDDRKRALQEKASVESSLEQCQGQLQRVERAFDDFKRQTMRNVKEKKDMIDALEAETSGLRTKLAEQTELKEQALQFAQGDKTSMTSELVRKEQYLSEARARLRHLEEQVKSLQRELKSRDDDTQSAADQEKRRRIILEKEREELCAQVKMLQDEKKDLRAQLSASTDEIASLKRQLHDYNDELSHPRIDLEHAKSEMASRVDSLELELHRAQTALVTERERTKKLRETVKQERQENQTELAGKALEVDTLKAKLQKMSADMERKERVEAERLEDLRSNETNLIKRLKLVQQRCDATASREAELQKELSELVSRTGEEREQLLEELQQTHAVNEVLQGDWSLHDGVRELKNRLLDEQKLVRQHATTLERKETHIRELESRIRRLEMRIREFEASSTRVKQAVEEDAEHELEEMSAKLAKLTMENQRLRSHDDREKVAILESSRVMKTELQLRCAKLKDEVKQLQEENENLRAQNEYQQEDYATSLVKLKKRAADHKKCEQQIERLTLQLEEKAAALAMLSDNQEDHRRSNRRKEATPTSSSRRVRELERALDEKEKKILMLNDHLTYLMTSTIELQHENEAMLALQQTRRRPNRVP